MRDLLLDSEAHDIVITNRLVGTVTDADAIVQNIKQRLLHFTNEWFLDLSGGTAWFEDILRKGQRQNIVEDVLKARIRETEGVTELTEFDIVESGDRSITVTFSATADAVEINDSVSLNI